MRQSYVGLLSKSEDGCIINDFTPNWSILNWLINFYSILPQMVFWKCEDNCFSWMSTTERSFASRNHLNPDTWNWRAIYMDIGFVLNGAFRTSFQELRSGIALGINPLRSTCREPTTIRAMLTPESLAWVFGIPGSGITLWIIRRKVGSTKKDPLVGYSSKPPPPDSNVLRLADMHQISWSTPISIKTGLVKWAVILKVSGSSGC